MIKDNAQLDLEDSGEAEFKSLLRYEVLYAANIMLNFICGLAEICSAIARGRRAERSGQQAQVRFPSPTANNIYPVTACCVTTASREQEVRKRNDVTGNWFPVAPFPFSPL